MEEEEEEGRATEEAAGHLLGDLGGPRRCVCACAFFPLSDALFPLVFAGSLARVSSGLPVNQLSTPSHARPAPPRSSLGDFGRVYLLALSQGPRRSVDYEVTFR